jgi:hypothetical protein
MEKMTMDELPVWIDCEAAVNAGTATALQKFIYNNEIVEELGDKEWRESLLAALNEVREG